MARASVHQSSFKGGEWGPLSYGRSDDPAYSTAMSLCLNGWVPEEGAWMKRSGTEFIVPTYQGAYANILPFDGSETCSFAMEFTNPIGSATGFLRLITQSSLVFTNDAQTITAVDASTGVITLSGNPTWAAGDQLMLVFPDVTSSFYPYPIADEIGLRNQVLTLGTFTAGTNATITLPYAGGDGPYTSTTLVGAQIMRVLRFTTPYTGGIPQIQALRSVQAEINNIILCGTQPPQELQITTQGTLSADPVFQFGALTMIDGPYLDPQAQSLTMSAVTGTVNLVAGSAVFAATDVGRSLRIFTQPPIYNPASAYASGNQVTDASGAWWTAIAAVAAGQAPGQAATVGGVATVVWVPSPNAGTWAWGTIATFTNSTHVSFTFDTTIPNMALISGNGLTASEWRLGVYSGTTGYPTCGVFYEGRLWLGGCVLNRFDTTTSNGVSQIIGVSTATFSPTDPYGNVLDNNGISEVLNSKGINQIQWMIGDLAGVLMGTLSGETIVAASQLGDPITPTSIQAHEITRYGSLNLEATRAGMAVIFAQKFGRRIMEYLDDAFSSKFTGRHLNEDAKHMTTSGVARLEYAEEPIPIVWALMNNGLLAGATYRRFTRFVSQPPEVSAWHWNMHGGNRVFTSMCVVPGKNGLLDRLFLVTNDPPATPGQVVTNYAIEIMQPPFDPSNSLTEGWFVDQASGPGPGNSGYDCGGGNPSGFFTTGSMRGADTTTPAAPPLLSAFQNITPGESPPAGGMLLLAKEATFFPGSVVLSNIPRFASGDEQSMSMSVWIGNADMNPSQGALLSSPALSYADIQTGTAVVSCLFGAAGAGAFTAAGMADGLGGYPLNEPALAPATYTPGNTIAWTHVMISAKSTGGGTGEITVTCVVNDTVLLNAATFAGVNPSGTNKMWPLASQVDAVKDIGLAEWAIGGQMTVPPVYEISTTTSAGPSQTFTVPPMGSLLANTGQGKQTGLSLALGPNGVPLIGPAPTPQAIYNELYIGHSYTVQTELTSRKYSGGQSNVPYPSSTNGVSGFRGSVAEMWVMPGQFIDWTSSATRLLFHEYDTITGSWGPVPLGLTGGKPGLGTPWLYLSGPPKFFPLNNATGKYLTETDTMSGVIDFDTGLGGGLQVSPLNFPYIG